MLNDAKVKVQESGYGITFVANVTGSAADNPSSAWNLTQEQAKKTAMAEFRHLSEYRLSLRVYRQEGNGGRNFMVTGISQMMVAPFGGCNEAILDDSHEFGFSLGSGVNTRG